MKKRITALFVILLLLLTSCDIEISLDGMKVMNYEFYSHYKYTELGIGSSDEIGLTGESQEITLEARRNVTLNHMGNRKNFNYKHTLVANKSADNSFDKFNRAYDVYHFMNTVEYWLLNTTRIVCGYRKTDIDPQKNENLSGIGYKACADEFLYYIMPSTWRQDYTHYSFEAPSDKNADYAALYTREIEGYLTDDILRVEIAKSGEVCLFEGFGRGKYDYLKSTILKDELESAEKELDSFLQNNGFGDFEKSTARIVTDNKGELYLKKELRDKNGDYYDTCFVNLPSATVQMTEEYLQMVEENYANNKALDEDSKTSTKDQMINDQNGDRITEFKYGNFSASYNACGAIAIHNAKILLNKSSSLSETIYDIETGYGVTFGGAFGSDDQVVPEMMKKYGIKCTEVSVDKISAKGVYIISFWHKDPPWNGTHTVAVSFSNKKFTAYNLYGDGKSYVMDVSSLKDRIFSCYKVE